MMPSSKILLLPVTKAPRHVIRALLQIRLVVARIEQALDICVLRHFAPLVALFLLLHDLLRQGSRRCIFDAVAIAVGLF